MRVPPIARNALAALGLGLLSINYAHATAAVLTPAAGQAVQTSGGVSNAVGHVVRGGYAVGTAALYLAEFGGNVTLAVGYRIAGGAALAAAGIAAVGPLVVGGLALGAGAAAAKQWLDDAHAAGKAQDYEYDPTTDTITKKPLGGWQPPSGFGDNVENNGVDIQALRDPQGRGFPEYMGMVQGPDTEWNGSTPMLQTIPSTCFGGYAGVSVNYCRTSGTGVKCGGFQMCTGSMTLPQAAPPGVRTKPTPTEWEQLAADLATIPVNPKLLENMGKPIPVDPVPVINPPDQSGAADVAIGQSNPAPNLQSRPQNIVGTAKPILGTMPQQYEQTTWTITPANSAANPYGVNVTANTAPTTVPANPTTPGTANPGTTPSTPDVCAQNPSSLMCQPPGSITDPSMPPIPELYVRKYPQGIVGIWQDKTAALTQTSLVTVLNQMMPTGITGGTCPTWTLNLSFGPDWADMGTHELAPPCWLWDVAKAIMIISALMLARQLIFGG